VRVLFFGFLRQLAGRAEVTLSLPEGATLRQLIDFVAEEFGEELGESLRPDSRRSLPLLIFVGEKDYRFAGGLDMRLEDKAEVRLIPPSVGG
jgi:molybdopterin converting factor small subunit